MLQKNNIYLLISLAVALVLTGCSRKVVYSHYEPTPIDGWEKNDTLSFTVVPIRHEGVYLEEVGLRTSGIYPFTGLTLIVEQRATPSGMMRSDTLHARLIDRDGSVQGKGISYFQYNFHLANLRLQANDTLHVSIRHNMKREILPGISDVGISLERIE
jgi:gliding motility-associated lipoprotein GldH